MSALTPKMREFLAGPRFGVLGTKNLDGSPHLTTMWFELEGDRVLMNTRRGRVKERNLRADPRASLVVHDGYSFVRIEGRIEFDEDLTVGYEGIRRLAMRYHGPEKGDQQARELYAPQKRITFWLPVEKVYANGI